MLSPAFVDFIQAFSAIVNTGGISQNAQLMKNSFRMETKACDGGYDLENADLCFFEVTH